MAVTWVCAGPTMCPILVEVQRICRQVTGRPMVGSRGLSISKAPIKPSWQISVDIMRVSFYAAGRCCHRVLAKVGSNGETFAMNYTTVYRRLHSIPCMFALVAALMPVQADATNVGPQSITSDANWDVANSPYNIVGDITVDSSATLSIENG